MQSATLTLLLSPCRHYGLQQLLEPLAVTWERLDYRLSWHLWGVLQALHYTHLSAPRQGLLHASYAAQLESAGLWHMAVFILLHIPEHAYVHRAANTAFLQQLGSEPNRAQVVLRLGSLNPRVSWKQLTALSCRRVGSVIFSNSRVERDRCAPARFVLETVLTLDLSSLFPV